MSDTDAAAFDARQLGLLMSQDLLLAWGAPPRVLKAAVDELDRMLSNRIAAPPSRAQGTATASAPDDDTGAVGPLLRAGGLRGQGQPLVPVQYLLHRFAMHELHGRGS